MKNRITILISIIILANGCEVNKCDIGLNNWIDEAPSAFKEFQKVKNEVLSNPEFINEFSFKGDLFLRILDTNKYSKYDVPNLKSWFENKRGYIAMNEGDTSFSYRQCTYGLNTARATIFYKKRRPQYKNSVVVIDSLELGNQWYAHVTKCNGCNE